MYLDFTNMSMITTLSIKDKHTSKYRTMRNWLQQRNTSMGDYIMEKWDEEFINKISTALTD